MIIILCLSRGKWSVHHGTVCIHSSSTIGPSYCQGLTCNQKQIGNQKQRHALFLHGRTSLEQEMFPYYLSHHVTAKPSTKAVCVYTALEFPPLQNLVRERVTVSLKSSAHITDSMTCLYSGYCLHKDSTYARCIALFITRRPAQLSNSLWKHPMTAMQMPIDAVWLH